MTIIEAFRNELESEAAITRKMLALVPTDRFEWQPHPKSMTLKRLATHIGELPGWVSMAINTDELDFQKNEYKPVEISSTQDLLAYFEKNYEEAMRDLATFDAAKLANRWVLRNGEQIHWDTDKQGTIRVSISQIIHHRAQLGVFLRLLDIPIPGSYGPSADESF